MKSADLPVLVVDDVDDVRQVIQDYLVSEGYPVDLAETAVDLLHKLRNKRYAVVLLDIDLGPGLSCEAVYMRCNELFPHIAFNHRKMLSLLGLMDESPASGRYLLPMIKKIAPETEVVMLSGTWREEDDGPLLTQLGAYTIVPKDTDDSTFSEFRKGIQHQAGINVLRDLEGDLSRFLDMIRAAKAISEEPQ